jgi:hypothetical protein
MKQLKAASIAAPGFFGLNSQDSSVTLASGFATKAENCVIDKFGRIGARRGWRKVNASTGNLGANDVKAIGEVIDNTGSSFVVVAGNNKIFKLVGDVLTELTYGGGGTAPTITDSHWSISTINGVLYLFQGGHDPLYVEPSVSTTVYKRISEMTGYTGTVAQADVSISAYGRLWIASTTSDKNTVQWSDTKLGQKWTAGSSGTLDLRGVWTHGTDEITGLAAHNGNLIIFGRKQMLIYANAMTPAELTLTEGIDRMGCIARDSIQSVGNDVFFLSETGVRSLSRTVQEKSMPLNDVSKNVRDDLIIDVQSETLDNIKAVYSPKDAFYIISLPTSNKVYCFDTRAALQDGSARVTTWTNIKPKSMYFTRDQKLLLGQTGYVGEYFGFLDDATVYRLQYYTNWFDLEAPTNLKFLKKVALTAIGGSNQVLSVKWGFDYSELYQSGALTLPTQVSSYFNIDLYNVGKYSDGVDLVNTKINTSGAGKVIQIGFEANINGNPLSIQKIDIFVTTGKTL